MHARRRSTAWLGLLAAAFLVACEGPADVVEAAADAARAQDRDAYMACFTPRSQPLLRALWRTAERAAPDLARLGAGDVVVGEAEALSADTSGRRRALVNVGEDGRNLPVVLHSRAGAWRIDLLDTERVLAGLGRR